MYQLKAEGQSICRIVNSLVSNFASVLFVFALREKLVKQTDSKLHTSELTILQIERSSQLLKNNEINIPNTYMYFYFILQNRSVGLRSRYYTSLQCLRSQNVSI